MLFHLAPPVRQDLSVAGKRAGLKHEANGDDETTRSGLFMEAVRIIKEMREATNGVYPRFALWENVPGAFSSNRGEDFRIVLEELIKIAEPTAVMPEVPKAGWPYADSYCGDGWSIAYRVFDAQYWGVPQRRRRIYLVADFRGECAREVLFERESLRGYFAESGTPWQTAAEDAEAGPGATDGERVGINGEIAATLDASYYKGCGMRQGIEREVVAVPYTLKIRSGCDIDVHGKTAGKGALIQTNKAATLAVAQDQYLFQPIKEQHLFENHSQDTRYKGPLDVSPMLPAQLGTGGNNTPFVVESTVKFETYQKVTGPLMANSHPGSYTGQDAYCDMLVAGKVEHPVAIDRAAFNQGQNAQYDPQYLTDGTTPTMVARGPSAVAYSMKSISRCGKPLTEQANPICASDYKDPDIVAYPPEGVHYIVRRLTPTECARLQGFPDAWGHPDVKEDLTDEEYQFWLNVRNTHAAINDKATKEYTKEQMLKWYNSLHTDSSEYKMWGNGIALPNALYVMQGIADVMESEQKAARKKWLDDLLGDCL